MAKRALQHWPISASLHSRVIKITGAVFTALLAITPAAQAKPFLYVRSFPHGGKVENCLAAAKQAMQKQGIDRFYDDTLSTKNRVGKVSGSRESLGNGQPSSCRIRTAPDFFMHSVD
jgi:hypothetical protein